MLRDAVRGALLQYDDTPEGEAIALAQLRRCGLDARAAGESPLTVAVLIRALFWDDPDIMSWGRVSPLVFIGAALEAYYGLEPS